MITDSVPIPDSRLCSWSAGIRSPHDPTRTERDATQGTHDIPGVVNRSGPARRVAGSAGNRHPRREGIGEGGDNPVRSMYANSTLNVNFNHISQHDRNLYRMLYRHHNSVSGYKLQSDRQHKPRQASHQHHATLHWPHTFDSSRPPHRGRQSLSDRGFDRPAPRFTAGHGISTHKHAYALTLTNTCAQTGQARRRAQSCLAQALAALLPSLTRGQPILE